MEPIDVWRMSASRPWQLEKTHSSLMEHLKYSGEIRLHLIESILVEDLSAQCIHFAKYNGYKIHIIKPAKGQGYAVDYALREVITSKYALKWEDDFRPEVDIPLDDCVKVMDVYSHVNQICFNKRATMSHKEYYGVGNTHERWPKEQRSFKVEDKEFFMCVKEKWWFGPALWRISFIKPIFKYWDSNTHNLFNNEVIIPRAMEGSTSSWKNQNNELVPTPEDIEKKVGCYIWGKTDASRMAEHTGVGDSIWAGEFQKRIQGEGRTIIGI